MPRHRRAGGQRATPKNRAVGRRHRHGFRRAVRPVPPQPPPGSAGRARPGPGCCHHRRHPRAERDRGCRPPFGCRGGLPGRGRRPECPACRHRALHGRDLRGRDDRRLHRELAGPGHRHHRRRPHRHAQPGRLGDDRLQPGGRAVAACGSGRRGQLLLPAGLRPAACAHAAGLRDHHARLRGCGRLPDHPGERDRLGAGRPAVPGAGGPGRAAHPAADRARCPVRGCTARPGAVLPGRRLADVVRDDAAAAALPPAAEVTDGIRSGAFCTIRSNPCERPTRGW